MSTVSKWTGGLSFSTNFYFIHAFLPITMPVNVMKCFRHGKSFFFFFFFLADVQRKYVAIFNQLLFYSYLMQLISNMSVSYVEIGITLKLERYAITHH